MDVKITKNLSLQQEQGMSQQQIQALELLHLPVLELQSIINAEIEKNPVLETDSLPEIDKNVDAANDEEWLDQVLKLDEDARYIKTGTGTYSSSDDEAKRNHYLNSVTVEQSLQESLLEQLRFVDMTKEMFDCCELIVSSLNDDAYLTSHPTDLVMVSDFDVKFIEKAIQIVQRMEPPGVAAKTLKERLMLQLERNGKKDSLAYKAVSCYLDDIAINRLPKVARKLKVSMDELKDILNQIHNLRPKIANETVSPHEYINEEITVIEENNRLRVVLNNEYLPNLHISKHYRDLLENPTTPKETKVYIKDKLKSGAFLITSILQRQNTIRRISQTIVDAQKDFFLVSPDALIPMTMSNIAKRVKLHETTISRTVSGKYLKCKYGLIPLRKFFSTGYNFTDKKNVSNNVIKNAIKVIIDNENPKKPLSDIKIVDELQKEGYKVARRTITKYREIMKMPSSNLRRTY